MNSGSPNKRKAYLSSHGGMKGVHKMQEDRKPDVLKRLSYIEGHVAEIRKMVEEDKYCIVILRQKHGVRKALGKLEANIPDGHFPTCGPEGIKRDWRQEGIEELIQL